MLNSHSSHSLNSLTGMSFIPRMKGSTVQISKGSMARTNSADASASTTDNLDAVLKALANLALGAGALPRPVQKLSKLDKQADNTTSSNSSNSSRDRSISGLSKSAKLAVESRIAERAQKIKTELAHQKSQVAQKISGGKSKLVSTAHQLFTAGGKSKGKLILPFFCALSHLAGAPLPSQHLISLSLDILLPQHPSSTFPTSLSPTLFDLTIAYPSRPRCRLPHRRSTSSCTIFPFIMLTSSSS